MKFRPKETSRPDFQDTIANRISKGTTVEGEINAETDIRIDGRIVGVLNCSAKVVIGKTGEMEGEIHCKDAALEGKLIGKLEVNGVLFLKKTASIEGEIYYKRLIVEEGASISGSLTMLPNTTKSLIKSHEMHKTKVIENSQQTA